MKKTIIIISILFYSSLASTHNQHGFLDISFHKKVENSYRTGNHWYCEKGFKKNKNKCESIFKDFPNGKQPANSWVSGLIWFCDEGYIKADKECIFEGSGEEVKKNKGETNSIITLKEIYDQGLRSKIPKNGIVFKCINNECRYKTQSDSKRYYFDEDIDILVKSDFQYFNNHASISWCASNAIGSSSSVYLKKEGNRWGCYWGENAGNWTPDTKSTWYRVFQGWIDPSSIYISKNALNDQENILKPISKPEF